MDEIFVDDAALGSFRGCEMGIRLVSDDAALALYAQNMHVRRSLPLPVNFVPDIIAFVNRSSFHATLAKCSALTIFRFVCPSNRAFETKVILDTL